MHVFYGRQWGSPTAPLSMEHTFLWEPWFFCLEKPVLSISKWDKIAPQHWGGRQEPLTVVGKTLRLFSLSSVRAERVCGGGCKRLSPLVWPPEEGKGTRLGDLVVGKAASGPWWVSLGWRWYNDLYYYLSKLLMNFISPSKCPCGFVSFPTAVTKFLKEST